MFHEKLGSFVACTTTAFGIVVDYDIPVSAASFCRLVNQFIPALIATLLHYTIKQF
jgi:hypothetical protein